MRPGEKDDVSLTTFPIEFSRGVNENEGHAEKWAKFKGIFGNNQNYVALSLFHKERDTYMYIDR